jgi:hypothetical protein
MDFLWACPDRLIDHRRLDVVESRANAVVGEKIVRKSSPADGKGKYARPTRNRI